jgi:hypothetical protein
MAVLKSGKYKGELTLTDIKKLVRGLEELRIPYYNTMGREELVSEIQKRGLSINHAENRLEGNIKVIEPKSTKGQKKKVLKKGMKGEDKPVMTTTKMKKEMLKQAGAKPVMTKQKKKLKGRLTKVQKEQTQKMESKQKALEQLKSGY